jgi:hypothetical protein
MSNISDTAHNLNAQGSSRTYKYLLLWLQWVSASIVASLVGLIAGTILFAGAVALILTLRVQSEITWFLQPMIFGGFIGLSLSTAQKLIIQQHLSLPKRFIQLSTMGALIALLLNSINDILASPLPLPFLAGIGGAIFGFSQWLVLHRVLRHSGWWVLANSVAWGAGGTLMYALLVPWTYTGGSDPLPGYDIFLDICGLPLVCIVTAAAITGFVLVWLLRASLQPHTPSPPPHSTSPR